MTSANIFILVASLLFFGNKSFLLLGRKMNRRVGWFLGVGGACMFVVYFFTIGTPLLAVLEIGLAVLMTYRFVAKEKTNKSIENALGFLTGGIILLLLILTMDEQLPFAQFFGACGMLVGTYFLIRSNQEQVEVVSQQERIGWLLYGVGHYFTAFIGFEKSEIIFYIFQVWQMMLCFGGYLFATRRIRHVVTKILLVSGAVATAVYVVVIINNY